MSNRGRRSTILVDQSCKNIQMPVFHFNPSEKCVQAIAEFSTKHREAKNKEFKSAWKSWIQDPDIAELFVEESRRLANTGYTGDLCEKLYFSARYYFRKKALNSKTQEERRARKPHEATDSALLSEMTNDIISQIQSNHNIRPAAAFEHYRRHHPLNERDEEKIKKIYKNRVFLIRKKLSESSSQEQTTKI